MARDTPTKVSVEFLHETDSAMKVFDFFSEEEVWIPFSLIESIDRSQESNYITLTIPEWLAEAKGMI